MASDVKTPQETHCWAGRWAFNGGNRTWATPCPDAMLVQHVVTDIDTPGSPVILLRTRHYNDVLAQGLISEPDPTPERVRDARRRGFRV